MRRVLGSLLPAVVLMTLLAACGDDGSDRASDEPTSPSSSAPPSSSEPTEPTESTEQTPTDEASNEDGGAVDFEVVDSITGTAAGGDVVRVASALPDESAAQEFISQFTNDGMRNDVLQAVAGVDLPEGRILYAAVVAIGCDVPSDYVVTSRPAGIQVVAKKVADPKPECLAAMTTVVLVTVSADDVA